MKEGNVTASYSESAVGVGGDSDRRIWPSEDNSSGLRKPDMKERCCTWSIFKIKSVNNALSYSIYSIKSLIKSY